MGMDSYYYPAGNADTESKITQMWNQLTNKAKGTFMNVEVAQGRVIPCQKTSKNVAEFTFKELCEDNRGSTDYMAVAENF